TRVGARHPSRAAPRLAPLAARASAVAVPHSHRAALAPRRRLRARRQPRPQPRCHAGTPLHRHRRRPARHLAATSVARALPTLATSLGFLAVPVLGMLLSTLWLGEAVTATLA